ncbi:SpoIIE family protein phosphatase [bacterium AH-315-C07]|nr:SpoIIE family protein phosphatase [bacterium AH-315-C07]
MKARRLVHDVLIYLVLAFYCTTGLSQTGTPYITNYSPPEYGGHAQVWSMVQDKLGLMYFGNLPGVLQYDGVNWNMIPVPNGSIARSLAVDKSGMIYVGCQGDLGYLAPNKTGFMAFISLLDSIPAQFREFRDVWRTYSTSKGIYFQTNKYLFLWSNNKMRIWKPETTYHLSYQVLDWIYISERGVGLKQVLMDTLYMVSDGEFFADKRVYTMLPYGIADILIGTREHGLFLYDGISPIRFEASINNFLIQNQLYGGVKLPNGDYALATIRRGGVIIDREGKLKYSLNRSLGIRDDNVYSLGIDKQDGLWMGLGNGIARVEASSPIMVFNNASGLEGSVEFIVRHKGKLHVATHQGVYIFDKNLEIKDEGHGKAQVFKPVRGIKTQAWALSSITNIPGTDPMLLVASSDGVYQIHGFKSKKLTNDVSLYIYQSTVDPNRVYVGLSGGLSSLHFENNRWVDDGKVGKVNKAIHMIKESKDSKLWLATKYEGTYVMDLSKGFNKEAHFTHLDTTQGLPKGRLNLFKAKGDVIFATPKGLFRYVDQNGEGRFKADTTFGKAFADGSRNVFFLYEDNNGNVWMNSGGENGVAIIRRDGTYDWVSKQFRRIPSAAIWAIYVEDNKKSWLGGPDGLVCYDRTVLKNYNNIFPTLLRKVTLGNDSVIFGGTYYKEKKTKKYDKESFHFDESSDEFNINWKIEIEKIISFDQTELFVPVLAYQNNSLTLDYSTPSFDNEKANQYQYYLEGYEENWSKWSNSTSKEYTNLYENEYYFHVRSKNIYGEVSKEAIYKFTILPPWHRSIWAFIAYVVLSITLILGIVWLSLFRLRAAKKRLTRIIKEQTAEVVKQKDELEKVNFELEKLSLVASKTDNPVLIADPEGVIEYVNETFTRISGFTLHDLNKKFGKSVFEISKNDAIEDLFRKSIDDKVSVKYETINLTKDGSEIWMASTLTPVLDRNGEVKKVVIIDTDITERKYNEEIIKQKNRDITDSITYAKRIQQALLPLERTIKNSFPKSFIYHKPKDIVSGDFYWFAEIKNGVSTKEGMAQKSLILAACDCTGHGVPGAFMSMIGNDLLNNIILEQKITNPTRVLNELHRGIKFVLKHDEEEIETKDGMDIAYCHIDSLNRKIEYAGAHRPLYIIRKGVEDIEIIKADRIGIGDDLITDSRSFTTHSINVNSGDNIYMFSDGYPDQFGGSRSKKYKTTNFRKLLLRIQHLSMNEQKEAIDNELTTWMGKNEQTDDILVIGFSL